MNELTKLKDSPTEIQHMFAGKAHKLPDPNKADKAIWTAWCNYTSGNKAITKGNATVLFKDAQNRNSCYTSAPYIKFHHPELYTFVEAWVEDHKLERFAYGTKQISYTYYVQDLYPIFQAFIASKDEELEDLTALWQRDYWTQKEIHKFILVVKSFEEGDNLLDEGEFLQKCKDLIRTLIKI